MVVNRIKGARHWIQYFGWRAAFAWYVYRAKNALGFPGPSTLRIRPRLAKYPVVVRLGGSSDFDVFRQVFEFEVYSCVCKIAPPKLILDLGANVGYCSAYFLSRFPMARVLAVEPDPENHELCRTNLAPYGERAQVVLGAAWSNRSKLVLSRGNFRDGRGWSTQVLSGEDGGHEACIEGWDISSLLLMTGETQVDLLKVDIERSELHVFGRNSCSWLPRVRNICIELHGADCEAVFLESLRAFNYDRENSGELTVCRNLRLNSLW